MCLSINKLTKKFNGIKAADNLSFEIEKGSITALIGPNGSGKTTIFNLITGFLKPDSGKIFLNNKDITGHMPHNIFHYGIGRTFQNIRLFPQMTVLDNILIGLKYHLGNNLWAALIKSKNMIEEDQQNIEKARELLRLVGLSNKIHSFAGELSYGQRRLLEIARTIGTDSDFYLFDEPTAGVFPNTIHKLVEIIHNMKSKGKAILFIEHNMKVVMDISDKIIVLNHGQKIAEGTPIETQTNKKVVDIYLGQRRSYAARS